MVYKDNEIENEGSTRCPPGPLSRHVRDRVSFRVGTEGQSYGPGSHDADEDTDAMWPMKTMTFTLMMPTKIPTLYGL